MSVLDQRTVELSALKERLRNCCLDSLGRLYLAEAGILAEGLKWDGTKYSATTPSVRDTANVLIALYKMRSLGIEGPLDPDRILARCVGDFLEEPGFPDVALLLWADSLGPGKYLARLWTELERRIPRDASDTMLLSWTLCAVCEYFKSGGDRRSTETLARDLHRRIIRNQYSRTGLFFSSRQRGGGLFRRRRSIAHLPSQVFALQALGHYSLTFGGRRSAEPALKCADRLCSLQGPQGQWWCVYDVRRGTVAREYPVYSVHQDGAMPAALSLVGSADNTRSFKEASERGLMWIFGNNELKQSMIDEEEAIVLRGIRREDNELSIIREMRAYHPGRCLYGLAVSESGQIVQAIP